MKNVKRLLSLVLMVSLVLSCTFIAVPVQSGAVKQLAQVATVVEPVEQIAKNEVVADTLLEAASYASTSTNSAAAPQSPGTQVIADKLAAEIGGKTLLAKVIDGVLSPLRAVTPVDSKEDLTLVLKKVFIEVVGGLADNIIKGIIKVFPQRDFVDYADYESKNFLHGTGAYRTAAAQNARWNVGYNSVSIIPDDVLTAPYFSAGYFNNYLGKNPITAVLDDQCFRAVAISDGSDSGIAVFVSLDGFSLSNTNVRELRSRLADFIADKNIVSLNVTTTHSHYCIDTSGLGVSLLPFVGENIMAGILGKTDELSSTNEKFMEGLFTKGAQAVKDAVNTMKPGKLYFRTTDIEDMISDKQTPIVFDPNANTLRFVPDNQGANEIWLVNAGIHPTGYDRASTEVSAEYPYAIVKYAKELVGADVAFYQGAQNEISKGGSIPMPEGSTEFDRIQAYGNQIAQRIIASTNDVEVEPYLNVTHAEIFMPIENPILMAAAKLNIINNICVNTTGKLEDALLVTEMGYAEFGSKFAIAMVPGEMTPELAWGGAKTAAESWTGKNWNYPSMEELAGRKLIVFGLTNDQIGYIMPDNDVATTLADALGGILGKDAFGENNSHYSEMLTTSRNVGSTLIKYFAAMLEDFKN
ncbi:MAG: hypothetical protein GXZ02_04610 [Clostridiales bacterium]|nr:hypothetical protein [Clostridiales bacterium]